MQSLRPSSTSYGGAYTTSLSQLVSSAVDQAATDSMFVFGNEGQYSSELVVWTTKSLVKAGEKKMGTDEKTFNHIFCIASAVQTANLPAEDKHLVFWQRISRKGMAKELSILAEDKQKGNGRITNQQQQKHQKYGQQPLQHHQHQHHQVGTKKGNASILGFCCI